ncbi:flavodoxin [Levilactobacillus huananensis]|uniref:flavodoxin n=1 Tax=Levilactobacillus huananensis TaxID=2486019 RepID=UPI000F775BB3|nr:flavodoxin [Levilactobacillus huananensis]
MLTAHVVFATITGNNQDVADIITEGLEAQGCQVQETEISQTDATEFKEANICVVCAYTYDGGALPEEGLDFFEDLPQIDLSHQVFGVAGSGDTFYGDDFNVAVDRFAAAFKQSGARQGAPNVKIDLEPDQDDINRLDAFAAQLVTTAQHSD